MAATELSDRLSSLEWDFHTAVQRSDDADAAAAAVSAVALIEAFKQGPLHVPVSCLADAEVAIEELIDLELTRWRAWAEGREYPTRDQISLFFAFHGAEKPWKLLLNEADERCRKSALKRPANLTSDSSTEDLQT